MFKVVDIENQDADLAFSGASGKLLLRAAEYLNTSGDLGPTLDTWQVRSLQTSS